MGDKKFNKVSLLWTFDIEVIAGYSCIVATNKHYKNKDGSQAFLAIEDHQYQNDGIRRFFQEIRRFTKKIAKEQGCPEEDIPYAEPILNGFNNFGYDNLMVNKMLQITQRNNLDLDDLREELKTASDKVIDDSKLARKNGDFQKTAKTLNFYMEMPNGRSTPLRTLDIFNSLANSKNSNANVGLKKHQAFDGLSIEEGGLHDLMDKKNLTDKERNQILQYCINDVETTQKVFENKAESTYKVNFDLIDLIIKTKRSNNDKNWQKLAEGGLLGETQANLTAYALSKKRQKYKDNNNGKYYNYEKMLKEEELGLRPELMKTANKTINLEDFPNVIKKDPELMVIANEFIGKSLFELGAIPMAKEMVTIWDKDDYFKNNLKGKYVNEQKRKKEMIRPLSTSFSIGDFDFGTGGVHMTDPTSVIFPNLEQDDVQSFYPVITALFEICQAANMNVALYDSMIDERVKMKKLNPAVANLLKLLLNTAFGVTRANPSISLNDPKAGLMICIICQILIYKYASMLEKKGVRLVQVNTDGVYYTIPENFTKAQRADIKSTARQWEDDIHADAKPGQVKRVKLESEPTAAMAIQKSVNEYLLFDENGKIKKGKGTDYKKTYLEPGSGSTPPVAFKMMIAKLQGKDPKEVYKQCIKEDLRNFQQILAVTKQYDKTELDPIEEVPPLTLEQTEGKSAKQIADMMKKHKVLLTEEQIADLPKDKLAVLEKEKRKLNPHLNRAFSNKNAIPVLITKVKLSDQGVAGKKDSITRAPTKFTIENGDLSQLSKERRSEIIQGLDYKYFRSLADSFEELWVEKRPETLITIEGYLPKFTYDQETFNTNINRFEKDILSKTDKIINSDKNNTIISELKTLLDEIKKVIRSGLLSSDQKEIALKTKALIDERIHKYKNFEKALNKLHQKNVNIKRDVDNFYLSGKQLFQKYYNIYKNKEIFRRADLIKDKAILESHQEKIKVLLGLTNQNTIDEIKKLKSDLGITSNSNLFKGTLLKDVEKNVNNLKKQMVNAQKKSKSKDR